MKALIVLGIIGTFALIAVSYRKHRTLKKTLISLGLFALLIAFGIAGGVMRAVLPLYMAHIIAVVAAWAALVWYILGGRLFWYAYLLPAASIALFWFLELTEGSRHEALRSVLKPLLA